ncbi:hypothetical protein ES708_08463 [subsurface metagenome]
MRNRRGLNKIGILAMALLLALGAMGTAYGAWVDEIYIEGTLSTGDIDTTLECGTHSSEVSCVVSSATTLTITLSDAPTGDYYCYFKVNNAVNSFPVEVSTLNLSGSYTDVSTAIVDLSLFDVINPGDTATGKVTISLSTDDYDEVALPFVLTVVVN